MDTETAPAAAPAVETPVEAVEPDPAMVTAPATITLPGAPVAPAAEPLVLSPAVVVTPPTAAPVQPDNYPITLTEFCLRHSKVERGVELLAAFHAMESRKPDGLVALETEFVTRLADFASRPVG